MVLLMQCLKALIVQVEGSPPGYDINCVLFGLNGTQAASMYSNGKIVDM